MWPWLLGIPTGGLDHLVITMAEVEDRIVISKRKGDGGDENDEKRLRVETQAALALVEKQNIMRSSTLLAPTMLLTGHQAAVYTLKFDPTGLQLASAGADRAIFLWDTRGECNNYNVLRGHKNVRASTDTGLPDSRSPDSIGSNVSKRHVPCERCMVIAGRCEGRTASWPNLDVWTRGKRRFYLLQVSAQFAFSL